MKTKAQDKRADVLRAALTLISEQGFHGTPMSQIATQANVGMGTIYRYFAGKEDLINALYIEIKQKLAQQALHGDSDQLPLRERFLLLLRNMAMFFIDNPAELLFIEQYANSPLITSSTREEILQMYAQVHALFATASAERALKELPLDVISTLAYGATLALVKLKLAKRDAMSDKELNDGIAAIWNIIER